MNTGDLSGQTSGNGDSAGVRAAIVATKPGNAGGAKGGRKADASSITQGEEPSPVVPDGDKQGEEDLWQRHKAERGVWSEKMLEALERGIKGNKWFSLIDKVDSERTLGLAWEKVKTNAGSCGVDNITVAAFAKDSQRRLLVVKEQLKRGDYQPKPVKRVWIPKAGSREKRPLGIPTVTDRVVQTALRMAIEPIFEKEFAPHSYGFRPGRGCKDALRHVNRLLKEGRLHVVDVDIKGYFDYLGYRFLRSKRTGRLCRLIRPKSLKAIRVRIHPLTKRANGRSLEEIIRKLTPILRGVHGYFMHAKASELKGLDGWVRGRLRSMLRKRQKKRGRAKGRDHQRWPKRYFERLGLFSLEQARRTVQASLREGANC